MVPLINLVIKINKKKIKRIKKKIELKLIVIKNELYDQVKIWFQNRRYKCKRLLQDKSLQGEVTSSTQCPLTPLVDAIDADAVAKTQLLTKDASSCPSSTTVDVDVYDAAALPPYSSLSYAATYHDAAYSANDAAYYNLHNYNFHNFSGVRAW